MTPDELIQVFRAAGLSVPADELDTMHEGVVILQKFVARLDDAPDNAPTPSDGDAS